MKNILLKFFAGTLLLSGCNINQDSDQEQKKPNIIFILTDDQQTGLLGVEGHPVNKTPNIDRIAEEGIIFKNAFAITPLSSPSRASFLTGKNSHNHRIFNNDHVGNTVKSHRLVTWPRQLREAGYETAYIGKWHMGLDDTRRVGFDHWFSFKGQGVYIDGVVNDNGQRRQITGHMTNHINNEAVDFVNKDHDNKPFAMVLSHKALHMPTIPTKETESLYKDYEYEPVPSSEENIKDKPVLARPEANVGVEDVNWQSLEGVIPEPGEPRRNRGMDPSSIVRDQLRCLASVDKGVGQLYEALEQNGQLDNTIIIFTSDQGMLMGEHGQFHQKRWPYDPVIRIPLLMRYPSVIPPGSVREKMVLNIDIAPTMLDIAGVESIIPLDGRSFMPLINNADTSWRKAFLAEYFKEKVVPRVPPWKAVRTENWKYIQYSEDTDSINELYNLQADPHEEYNLIDEPDAQHRIEAMQQKLDSLLKNR